MNLEQLKGKTALVTGASSGLGVDFAWQLAEAGCNLILVARRLERLEVLKAKIIQRHNITIDLISLDLSEADAPQKLYQQFTAEEKQVDVLINNAGYGLFGQHLELAWEKELNMMQLDMVTVVQLTKLFCQDVVSRQAKGYVLLISSIGAYQATPGYAVYSAAKSFVLLYGEALHEELKDKNIHVTTLSPGITETEFLKVSGQRQTLYQRLLMMKSDDVTRIGLNAMVNGKLSVVPGLLNKLTMFSLRLTPRVLMTKTAGALMKN